MNGLIGGWVGGWMNEWVEARNVIYEVYRSDCWRTPVAYFVQSELLPIVVPLLHVLFPPLTSPVASEQRMMTPWWRTMVVMTSSMDYTTKGAASYRTGRCQKEQRPSYVLRNCHSHSLPFEALASVMGVYLQYISKKLKGYSFLWLSSYSVLMSVDRDFL